MHACGSAKQNSGAFKPMYLRDSRRGHGDLLTASKHWSEKKCIEVAGNRERVLFNCLHTATNALVKQRT